MLKSTFVGSLCIQKSTEGNCKSFMIGAKVCSGFYFGTLVRYFGKKKKHFAKSAFGDRFIVRLFLLSNRF